MRRQRAPYLSWRPMAIGIAWIVAIVLLFISLVAITFSELQRLRNPEPKNEIELPEIHIEIANGARC